MDEELKTVGTAKAYIGEENYKTILTSRQFTLVADEPVEVGGRDLGPSPGDLICMSLAACKTITLKMYAQRKQWPVDEITVKVTLVKYTANSPQSHCFNCEISVSGNLNTDQKERMLHIAKACPVSKLLTSGAEVASVIK